MGLKTLDFRDITHEKGVTKILERLFNCCYQGDCIFCESYDECKKYLAPWYDAKLKWREQIRTKR